MRSGDKAGNLDYMDGSFIIICDHSSVVHCFYVFILWLRPICFISAITQYIRAYKRVPV